MSEFHASDRFAGPLRSLLSESEFLATTSVGVVLFDKRGVIVDCNESVVQLVGGTRETLIGRTAFDDDWDAVNREGKPFGAADIPGARTAETGEPTANAIMGVNVADGTRRWFTVDVCAAVVDGSIKGVISSYFDLTEQVVRERFLELLTEVQRATTVALDADEFLASACHAFVSVGGYGLTWIARRGLDQSHLEVVARAGTTDVVENRAAGGVRGDGDSDSDPVNQAIATGLVQVRLDLGDDGAGWRRVLARSGLRSVVAIPIVLDQQSSCLVVASRHRFEFTDRIVEGLVHIATGIEFGAAHVASMNQLERSLDGTIAALARMTENRDPYTAGHQLGVGRLGEAIARELGLDDAFARLIRQSGVVHDIGKISVPAEILTRPGRLNQLEFTLIKKHPEVGADILTEASLPWPIAEVAHQHHERIDGSGYPDGLVGSAISLPARIIAVADVIEAMTHHRPYRAGLGLEGALDEVRNGAGRLYDTEVVEACLAVFAAGYVLASNFGFAPI